MTSQSPGAAFEKAARKYAVCIAENFITVAKDTRKNSLTMTSLAAACAILPFAAGLVSPWPLALILPPIIMYKALKDTHLRQKQMQDIFREALDSAPQEVRGIVYSELLPMEKTVKSFRTDGIKRQDILPQNEKTNKRAMELGASAFMLMPPFTTLAIPSFFYLLLQKETRKTTALIAEANAVLEANKDVRQETRQEKEIRPRP